MKITDFRKLWSRANGRESNRKFTIFKCFFRGLNFTLEAN